MPASVSSFGSRLTNGSVLSGRQRELNSNKRFYEKLEDFKQKVKLHEDERFVVYRARCAYSGAVVMLKGYLRDELTVEAKERVWNEMQVTQNIGCPFIIKCFDCFEDQGNWWLVFENAAGGDLLSALNDIGAVEDEGWVVTQVMLPLLQTLGHLHTEGIIHRSIRPENLLFNSERVCKMSGFYYCNDVTRVGYPKGMVGSLDYVAPEVFLLNDKEVASDARVAEVIPDSMTCYDYKSDVWQVGVLTYDVLTGAAPFEGDTPAETIEAIMYSQPDYPDYLSQEAVDFISACLTKRPFDRPSARQLLAHPWIRCLLNWQPSPDFEEPVQILNPHYYSDDHDPDAASGDGSMVSDDFLQGLQPKWYNPKTWQYLYRRDPQASEQDLSGLSMNWRQSGNNLPGSQSGSGNNGGALGWARRMLGLNRAVEPARANSGISDMEPPQLSDEQAEKALPDFDFSSKHHGMMDRLGSDEPGFEHARVSSSGRMDSCDLIGAARSSGDGNDAGGASDAPWRTPAMLSAHAPIPALSTERPSTSGGSVGSGGAAALQRHGRSDGGDVAGTSAGTSVPATLGAHGRFGRPYSPALAAAAAAPPPAAQPAAGAPVPQDPMDALLSEISGGPRVSERGLSKTLADVTPLLPSAPPGEKHPGPDPALTPRAMLEARQRQGIGSGGSPRPPSTAIGTTPIELGFATPTPTPPPASGGGATAAGPRPPGDSEGDPHPAADVGGRSMATLDNPEDEE